MAQFSINTSRGAVVETKHLKRTLLDKHLAAAVIDVWEEEPNISTALLELVTLGSPHIAGYSLDGKINALRINYEAVCRFLSIPIDRDVKYTLCRIQLPKIKIDMSEFSFEQTLYKIIKECYDILLDDQSLRQLMPLPEEERRNYFQKLRAEYRIRREFFNYSVCLPDKAKEIANVIRLLGFKVKDEEN